MEIPLRLTVRGRLMKIQPTPHDKIGLDPHRSEPGLVQLYGGGARVAVLDMKFVSWDVLAPVWRHPLVAHNAAFELAFLAKRGIYPKVQCTMQNAGEIRRVVELVTIGSPTPGQQGSAEVLE